MKLPEIILQAEPIVKTACELNQEPIKQGGCLCVANPEGEIILVSRLGQVRDRERGDRYFRFCQEKARRLISHPGDVSSWQSREPENDKWGGGVRLETGAIFTFSGLPELWDEACMVTLAMALAGLSEPTGHLRRILETSQNPHGAKLIAACRR